MTDLTPVINGIITLAVALITAFVLPWIKGKTAAQDRTALLEWADIAVGAAQQLYFRSGGEARKEYVRDFLREKGYDVDDNAVDAAIEAAVLKLHMEVKG